MYKKLNEHLTKQWDVRYENIGTYSHSLGEMMSNKKVHISHCNSIPEVRGKGKIWICPECGTKKSASNIQRMLDNPTSQEIEWQSKKFDLLEKIELTKEKIEQEKRKNRPTAQITCGCGTKEMYTIAIGMECTDCGEKYRL